ncbi:MAG: hypothetical protein DME19_00665 [Verrucomicrobia bacterium]|nr:MAG: hypothetical protein DME19_00665 [Verrucomicrobiota bacterium]
MLDNFDDNTKTGWTDFTFIPGFGIPVETGGQFIFAQPPAGQAIFSASTKTSETFTLQDGRTIEFRVDLVSGGGKDSFAVLAFIPTSSSASTLAGYGFAKSTTDILITKGIGKYFYNENPTPEIKNDNVTMVLSMTGKGGNAVINAKVLDKDNNNAVLFDRTFVDTPSADVLSDGTDDPAAPYFGSGNFVLYLYQDYDAAAPENPYQVTYDNAEVFVLDNTLLDDFNDNTKTAWQDFTFIPGFGIPAETGSQFVFTQPPAGQAIFSASTKTSRTFDVQDGERLEFHVDLVAGGDKDSFAVLAFIPTSSSVSSLGGYGLAKSTTDILVTKGIGKYFYNENPTPPVKNTNVTLVLSMEGRGTNVIIVGKVLDKDNSDAVIFEQRFVDTPAADVLSDGTDSPAAPYFGSGNFVLYLYQDYDPAAPENPYQVVYDNAVGSAPPVAGNTPPVISDVLPDSYANFLPASTQISFKVTDDKPVADSRILVTLNGVRFPSTNGLTITGTGNTKNASLGSLVANVSYAAVIQVTDSDNVTVSTPLYFDTFSTNDLVLEVEDYNFGSGQFLDNPVPVSEGGGAANSYSQQAGVQGVDFDDTRATPRPQDTLYRPGDPVRMQHSLDKTRQKYIDAGGSAAGVYDYDVGDIASGEFLNYTRTFATGTYEVYLRESLVNMARAEAALEKVVTDRTQPNQSTKPLGSFIAALTGYQYRNFPLTDGLGQSRVVVRLSGVETLRLHQVTAEASDGGIFQNYLILVPVPDPGVLSAIVMSVSPGPGAALETVAPVVSVNIQNRDTAVQTNSIVLSVNGTAVMHSIVGDTNGATISYAMSPLPPSGSTNAARIVFTDSGGVTQTNDWSFVVTYKSLDQANRQSGAGGNPGFKVRVVQAPLGSNLDNSLQRAEDQLAPNSTIAKYYETNVVDQIINDSQNGPGSADGYFPDDALIPGLDVSANGSDDIAMEILTYLDLPAGVLRFGVRCDDGYKMIAGNSFTDLNTPTLAFHNGGPADETFDFVVPQAGLYPFRMVWYERGGAAFVEWFSVDPGTGARTLINDPAAPGSIKAFTSIAPAVVLESAANLAPGAFAAETGAVVDATAKTVTLPLAGNQRFYRLRAGTALTFDSIQISGGNVVLKYR